MLGGKRSDVAITLDILRLVRKGERKTRIMYGANLSYGMLTRYLEFLTTRGFIEEAADGSFKVTAKGSTLAADLERLHRHFDVAEDDFLPTSPRAL